MGQKGTNVYLLYAVTDDNSTQFQALSESGQFMLHNEKDIEIVAGSKLKKDVGIENPTNSAARVPKVVSTTIMTRATAVRTDPSSWDTMLSTTMD